VNQKKMIVIDGSQGEGGGQIFRTALSLALCQRIPIRIEKIRAGRKKPGLLRQHLACLRAAKAISHARVEGESLGADCVQFEPALLAPGCYHFVVGSAGSTTLIFQTVLPALAMTDSVSELRFEGGTHNGMAPSFDFLAGCFLPVIKQMGFQAEIKLDRYGFYPAGGGIWTAKVGPKDKVRDFILLERGDIVSRKAVAVSSNLPAHVTQRELRQVEKKCAWSSSELEQILVDSQGPGNLVSLRIGSSRLTEMIEASGELGIAAERVANITIKQMNRYLNADVPVGEHLTDQLLLPMWLNGVGRFRSLKPSLHTQTNIDVIEQITGQRIEYEHINGGTWEYRLNTPDIH